MSSELTCLCSAWLPADLGRALLADIFGEDDWESALARIDILTRTIDLLDTAEGLDALVAPAPPQIAVQSSGDRGVGIGRLPHAALTLTSWSSLRSTVDGYRQGNASGEDDAEMIEANIQRLLDGLRVAAALWESLLIDDEKLLGHLILTHGHTDMNLGDIELHRAHARAIRKILRDH